MRGNCEHSVFEVDRDEYIWKAPQTFDTVRVKGVAISNDDDPYFIQIFETWAEVDEFVAKLHRQAEITIGKKLHPCE